jgi:hypothetical protein
MDIVLHKDGTVTYWSVYSQVWERRVSSVPDEEYAAMPEMERTAVFNHLKEDLFN